MRGIYIPLPPPKNKKREGRDKDISARIRYKAGKRSGILHG